MSIIKQIEVGNIKIEVISLADLGLFSYLTSPNPYNGYVISEKGHVYSNNRNAKYVKIGSIVRATVRGRGRVRVIIAGNRFYTDDLLKRALPLFKKAKKLSVTVATVPAPETRTGVFKKFVVSAVDNDVLKFASTPKLHDSRKSAEDEACRLAKANNGIRFAVCEVVSTVVAGAVAWEK